MGDEREHHNII